MNADCGWEEERGGAPPWWRSGLLPPPFGVPRGDSALRAGRPRVGIAIGAIGRRLLHGLHLLFLPAASPRSAVHLFSKNSDSGLQIPITYRSEENSEIASRRASLAVAMTTAIGNPSISSGHKRRPGERAPAACGEPRLSASRLCNLQNGIGAVSPQTRYSFSNYLQYTPILK